MNLKYGISWIENSKRYIIPSINFQFVLIIYTAYFPNKNLFLSVPNYPTIWEVAVTHARNKNQNYLGSHFRQPRK